MGNVLYHAIRYSEADIYTLYPDIDCHFEYQHDILFM